jgi:hypothetical protein
MAPGLSGIPDSGTVEALRQGVLREVSAIPIAHYARQTGNGLADSMRQTTSIARWVSELVTFGSASLAVRGITGCSGFLTLFDLRTEMLLLFL